MKNALLAIATAAMLTACTATEEMIAAQKDRCTNLGYKPGTPQHAECAERGTLQQQATQNAAVASAFSSVLNRAIWSNAF
jgi:hypothetical protein